MLFGLFFLLFGFLIYANANDVTGLTLSNAPSVQKNGDFTWKKETIKKMWEERKSMGHTPLKKFPIPGMPKVDLFFKDESATKTGNLKHRFSWALFMWAIMEGHITKNTTVYEASSGNTATSEAYMARLINVPFIAVIPDVTEQTKIDKIENLGGNVLKTDISQMFIQAALEAEQKNGFYMNQFANADRAEEFHESGNENLESSNVMHEIVQQLKKIGSDEPDYFIHTAGTGGTISSVGRYVQKYDLNTQVIMADTQYSIYYDYVLHGKFKNESGAKLWIKPGMAGTGFGYSGPAILGVTTSLQPSVIHQVYKIPDLASTAAMHFLKANGLNGGTSTGLNFLTALTLAAKNSTKKIKIVTILADSSKLYEKTYYNKTWIKEKFEQHGGIPVFNCWKNVIQNSFLKGTDPLTIGSEICNKDVIERNLRLRRRMNLPNLIW